MIDTRENAQAVVDLLNNLLETDRVAVTKFITTRTPCSQELIDHPTVVFVDGGLGPIGFLNGLFSASNRIVIRWRNEKTELVGFAVKDLSDNDVDGFECEYCYDTVTKVRPDDEGYVWGYCGRCAPKDAVPYDGTMKPGDTVSQDDDFASTQGFHDFLVGLDKPLPEVKIENHWGGDF